MIVLNSPARSSSEALRLVDHASNLWRNPDILQVGIPERWMNSPAEEPKYSNPPIHSLRNSRHPPSSSSSCKAGHLKGQQHVTQYANAGNPGRHPSAQASNGGQPRQPCVHSSLSKGYSRPKGVHCSMDNVSIAAFVALENIAC